MSPLRCSKKTPRRARPRQDPHDDCVHSSVNRLLQVSCLGFKSWNNLSTSLIKGGIARVASTGHRAYHPLFATMNLSSTLSEVTFRQSKWAWETSVDLITTTQDYEFSYSFIDGKWARESSVDQFSSKPSPLPPKTDLTVQCVPTASSSTQVNRPPINIENIPVSIEKKSSTHLDAEMQTTVSIQKTPSTDSTTKESLDPTLTESESEFTVLPNEKEELKEIKPQPSKKLSGCQKRKKSKAKASTGSNLSKEVQKSPLSSVKKTKLILGVVRISSRTRKAPPPIRVARKDNVTTH